MKIPIRSPHHYEEIETDHLKGGMFRSEPLSADNYVASLGGHGRLTGRARRLYIAFEHKGVYNDMRVPRKSGDELTLEEKAKLL